MLTGTNLKYTKAYNFRIVLETIRLNGPLSRADIARRTGLTAQTISNIIRKAIRSGLVIEGDLVREGRGAPSTSLTLNPDGAYSIGLDLDKDHLTGILLDLNGVVRQRVHEELNFPPPEEALDRMEALVHTLVEREGIARGRVWGVGVGFPGPLDIARERLVTNVVNPTAFPGWHNVPVVDILSKRLSLPIFLENNATAAAVGERWYGAGRRISTFFYVFFSVGLGGGLIVGGQPFEGHTGNAGELGYIPTSCEDGMADIAGGEDRPHIGQHFNLPRLYAQLAEHGVTVTRPDELAGLYQSGNPQLMEWLERAAEQLAPVILAIEYIVDPEAIFFGGRLPDVLIRDLMERLGRRLPALRITGKPTMPKLILGTAGVDAAALGVATLPVYASFAPIPKVLMKPGGGDHHPATAARDLLSDD